MSNVELGLCIGFALMFVVMAYRGVLGMFLWRWTRIPLAFLGGLLLAVASNGVPEMPVIRDEEAESEIAEHVETSDLENPTNDDDRAAKHLWSLKGFSPMDVLSQCVTQAANGVCIDNEGNPDEEVEGWDFSQDPPESMQAFKLRKKLERA